MKINRELFSPTSTKWMCYSQWGGIFGTLDECISELPGPSFSSSMRGAIKKHCVRNGYFSAEGYIVALVAGSGEAIANISSRSLSNRDGITKATRYELFRSAGFRCQCCGVSAGDAQLHIDHIIPRAKGGVDHVSNYQVLCETCNRSKGVSA